MNKEDLLTLGLTDEQAEKVLAEMAGLRKQLKERDKQLADLQKAAGDNAELQKQIADLQKQNAEQQKTHEAELAQLKLDSAVEAALAGAKARNGKAVKAMLDMSKVKLGEDGKLAGLDEQIEALKKSDGYMFAEAGPVFRGFQPGSSSGVPDAAASGFESRLADARKNNNTLEVIKIKQEAAAAGVVLM